VLLKIYIGINAFQHTLKLIPEHTTQIRGVGKGNNLPFAFSGRGGAGETRFITRTIAARPRTYPKRQSRYPLRDMVRGISLRLEPAPTTKQLTESMSLSISWRD